MKSDKWFESFVPIRNHIDTTRGFNGFMFDTDGPDLVYIEKLYSQHKRRRIWTLLEVDGRRYIAAGMHWDNREGYFVTTYNWDTGDEEVSIDG